MSRFRVIRRDYFLDGVYYVIQKRSFLSLWMWVDAYKFNGYCDVLEAFESVRQAFKRMDDLESGVSKGMVISEWLVEREEEKAKADGGCDGVD